MTPPADRGAGPRCEQSHERLYYGFAGRHLRWRGTGDFSLRRQSLIRTLSTRLYQSMLLIAVIYNFPIALPGWPNMANTTCFPETIEVISDAIRSNSNTGCQCLAGKLRALTQQSKNFFLGSFLGGFLGGSPQVLMGSFTYGNCKVVRDIPLPQSYGPVPVPAHSLI